MVQLVEECARVCGVRSWSERESERESEELRVIRGDYYELFCCFGVVYGPQQPMYSRLIKPRHTWQWHHVWPKDSTTFVTDKMTIIQSYLRQRRLIPMFVRCVAASLLKTNVMNVCIND